MDEPALPGRDKLTKYLAQALSELGGTATRREVVTKAMEIGPFTKEQRALPSPAAGKHYQTKLEYELNHALSVAKEAGELTNPRRDLWALPTM